MTRLEDNWNCNECGQLQGRHDMWFEGVCGHCKVPTTRDGLIDWLCWADPNGVYRDEDSIREGMDVLTYDEALELYLKLKEG